jgi:hypothetical protein
MNEVPRTSYSLENAHGKAKFEDGKLLFIWGGDGERDNKTGDDDDSQQPDDDDKDNKDENKNKSGDSDPDDADDDDDVDDKKSSASVEEQLDAEKRKNIALQKKLDKQKQDKDAAEADKDAAKDRDKYKTQVEKRDKLITDKLMLWSVETNKKYQWRNAEDVLAFIKPDEISIDLEADDPTVEGLDLALKRIAKEKPYLLKQDDDEQDADEGHPASGSHPRGGKTDQGQTEDDAIRLKFKLPGFGAQAIRPL